MARREFEAGLTELYPSRLLYFLYKRYGLINPFFSLYPLFYPQTVWYSPNYWQLEVCQTYSDTFIDKSNYRFEIRLRQAECKLHSSQFESTTKWSNYKLWELIYCLSIVRRYKTEWKTKFRPLWLWLRSVGVSLFWFPCSIGSAWRLLGNYCTATVPSLAEVHLCKVERSRQVFYLVNLSLFADP